MKQWKDKTRMEKTVTVLTYFTLTMTLVGILIPVVISFF